MKKHKTTQFLNFNLPKNKPTNNIVKANIVHL